MKGCTNSESWVAVEIKFCVVVPDICGAAVGNLLLAFLVVARILRSSLFLENV
jgi:hypothetical protein